MLLRSGFCKILNMDSRSSPPDGGNSKHRGLDSKFTTRPTSEERMVKRPRPQRSPCPEPEDLDCVEIPAVEFYNNTKRTKIVDTRSEDKCYLNTRTDGLVETAPSLEGPINLGSSNASPEISVCRARDGGFTAINRDWPTSCRTLRSSQEISIFGTQTERPTASNRKRKRPREISLDSSKEMSVSTTQTSEIAKNNRVWLSTNGPDCIHTEDANSLIVPQGSPIDDSPPESASSDNDCSPDSDPGRKRQYQVGCFQGTTVHRPREVALTYAFEKQNSRIIPHVTQELVLWVDGSGDKGRAGDAVTWRVSQDPEVLNIRARHLPWVKNSIVTEMYAIAHGLEVAMEQIADDQIARQTHMQSKVFVFSDCLSVIQMIGRDRNNSARKLPCDEPLAMVDKRTAQLCLLGARVELHWVPGHAGVVGNELSDLAAARAGRNDAFDLALVLPHMATLLDARQKLCLALSQLAAKQA